MWAKGGPWMSVSPSKQATPGPPAPCQPCPGPALAPLSAGQPSSSCPFLAELSSLVGAPGSC